jgi:hypothetical protein
MAIGRGRRREHPKDTSKGGHVTFGHYGCCATSGYACAHPREPGRGQLTFGSHGTTVLVLRKKCGGKAGHAQNILPVRDTSGHVTDVTSGQKAPLG